jgi:hypothetical protein
LTSLAAIEREQSRARCGQQSTPSSAGARQYLQQEGNERISLRDEGMLLIAGLCSLLMPSVAVPARRQFNTWKPKK